MAGYYGRRAQYTPQWHNQRIYPRQEPVFDAPAPTTTSASPPDAAPLTMTGPESGAPVAAVQPPPPMYFPGEAQLARIRAQQTGQRTRRNGDGGDGDDETYLEAYHPASSHTAQLEWVHHPWISSSRWTRLFRVNLWWSALIKRDKERLWTEWPVEFGGKPLLKREISNSDDLESTGASRISRTLSRRSGVSAVDSGVALTPHGTLSSQQHPLELEFRRRVDELNILIPAELGRSRQWLSMLEIVNYAWIVALIAALAQGGGSQTRFLEAVELSLVVIIILNGIGVNAVRMRRWALRRALRIRSRDWSPLPLMHSATTTNQALLSNAGLAFDSEFQERQVAEARSRAATSERGSGRKDGAGPTLRWRLRDTEGSWWLSYRPVIKVELATPASNRRYFAQPAAAPVMSTVDGTAAPTELLPPPPPLSEDDLPPPVPVLAEPLSAAESDSARQRQAPAYTE